MNTINRDFRNVLFLLLIPLSLSAQGIFSKEHQQKTSRDTLQKLKITPFVHGTLQLPSHGVSEQLIIFIMGSGDVDRDGNQATTRRNTFKKMANELAKKGIATFRYDKRVIPMLKQNMDVSNMSFDDFINDAEDAIAYFKNQKQFKQIYIAGHSQGALVGAIVSKTDVDGFMSLAGASKPIDEVIISQIENQMGIGAEAEKAFSTLKKEGQVTNYNPALYSVLNPKIQPFMLSWMAYNPAEEITKLNIPVLIITGTKDLQVSVEDAEALDAASKQSELKIFENMNHVLVTIEGGNLENTKSYNETWHLLADDLVDTIAKFVQQN